MRATRSSIIGTTESISSSIYVRQLSEQINPSSAKNFLQTCPYRTEINDRTNLSIIQRQDMNACLRRLSAREDVYGVMVMTIDGRVLYSNDVLNDWSSSLTTLCQYVRNTIQNLDPNDTIHAVRLRTKKYEIIITIHDAQLLIVMQIVADLHSKRNDQSNGEAFRELRLHK